MFLGAKLGCFTDRVLKKSVKRIKKQVKRLVSNKKSAIFAAELYQLTNEA